MEIELIKHSSWSDVVNAARSTIGKQPIDTEPSSEWKRKMLIAEHSPIRTFTIHWCWTDLPYWVSVHFVRHKIGIEHFVSTQRSDRTGNARGSQDNQITHECIANAQAIINISRKRLCKKASVETREAWQLLLDELKPLETELVSVCVPECMYRGFCPEFETCGYYGSSQYNEAELNYIKEE